VPKADPKTRPSGVLVIDKPRGPTSHDVVWRVRRALSQPAIGHAGTLDPMATGVLVLAVGEATKLVPYLSAHEKAYEATIALGVATDTLDAEGAITEHAPVSAELRAALLRSRGRRVAPEIEHALASERARAEQIPPAHSAVHVEGERAYEKARRGEEVELAARPVSVKALELLDAGDDDPPWLAVSVRAAKGYYVRSLARDLSVALGTVGHLTSLRRTRSGCFVIEEALPLDTPGDELEARLQSLGHVASRALPSLQLTELGANHARHGRAFDSCEADVVAEGPHAWFDTHGKLIAVGQLEEGKMKVLRGFSA
jgi:tRNA pseudouridine55 synthase